MNWHSIGDLLAMGGYALYVWGAIGMGALLIGTEILLLSRRWRRALAVQRRAQTGDSS